MPTMLFAGAAAVALLSMPHLLAAYPLFIFSHMLVFAIACMALNLLYGTAGSLSLGHATYFGVAAYAGGFLHRFLAVDSLELYLASGIACSTVFACAFGFLCVRTTRIHFTILTLALSMVVHSVVVNGAVYRLFGGSGRALYLLGGGGIFLPRLTILGSTFTATEFISALYYVIAAAFLLCVLLLWRISASPFGYALRAIRDNETRAAFIGIPVQQYRWYAFTLSGLFMGVAGGLYGQLARQITPEQCSRQSLYWRPCWAAHGISSAQSWELSDFLPSMRSQRSGAWADTLFSASSSLPSSLDFRRVSPAVWRPSWPHSGGIDTDSGSDGSQAKRKHAPGATSANPAQTS